MTEARQGDSTTRIVVEWQRRVAAEYRSAALTAQAVHWMIQVGVSHELVHTGLRVVRDELDHAELSTDAMRSYGGDTSPALAVDALALPPRAEGPLASLVDTLLRNFCVGETLAVPLFQAMWQGVTDEVARAVVQRVLRDEAVHRQLGWDLLDELIELDPGVVRFATGRVDDHLASAEASYAASPDDAELGPAERAAGLLAGSEYHRISWDTVRQDIAPRFDARGVVLADRWVRGTE